MKLALSSCMKMKIPTRFSIGMMLFTACWVTYMIRVNMSINILEMVNVHASSNKSQQAQCISNIPKNISIDTHIEVKPLNSGIHDDVVRYNWTNSQQGVILGMYFWGYLSTSLFGGWMAEYFGPKVIVGVCTGLSGILTILSPLAASMGYMTMLICRYMIGALGGVLYPCLHCLVANWAPPEEKGKFVSALLGGTFGTVVTWSLCGVLISNMGWEWAFYIPGIITLMWCIVWFIVVSNTPEEHPRIDFKEKMYILERIGDKVDNKKKVPPFKSILLSLPFWAFTVLHYGNLWGLYFLLTAGPKFISQVLGFDISKAGIIASLPYISRMLMGFIFGSVGDVLRKKETISVTAVRKTFVLFSHFMPAVCLVALTFVGCNPLLSVAVLTASLGFNGAATITNLQNHQDLAPNFVGTLYGIANFIGTTTGFLTPLITAHFTKERNGIEEWRWIFMIGAAVYFVAGLFFVLFGSGETQPWNTKMSNGDAEADVAKSPEESNSSKSKQETIECKL